MKHHIYHHNDLDGQASAAIIAAWINEFCDDRDILFYEMNYGRPFDDSKIDYENDYIYMVDFSLQPLDRMLPLLANPRFIWIDHHKTSCQFVAEHPELGFCEDTSMPLCGIVTSNSGAGCELTWQFYYGATTGRAVPPIIEIISQYDTWNHNGPYEWDYIVLPVKTYLGMLDTDPASAVWDTLLDKKISISTIVNIGDNLLKFDRKRMAHLAKEHMYEGEFCGLKALIFNTAEGGSSQFEAATDVTKYDIMVTYRRYKDQYWTVGLYSTKKEVDCSALAKKLGEAGPYKTGGGHPGAAGFQTDTANISALLKF